MSSKYCIWDPDLRFLSLGTVTALCEIELVRYLRMSGCADMAFSYLGFYIHSNKKMRCAHDVCIVSILESSCARRTRHHCTVVCLCSASVTAHGM